MSVEINIQVTKWEKVDTYWESQVFMLWKSQTSDKINQILNNDCKKITVFLWTKFSELFKWNKK